MAKKRKKDKEEKEEYEFRPPEFNEREFLKKEMSDTRTAVVTIIYAGVFGGAAGLITILAPDLAGIAFLVGIAGMVLLRYFYPMFNVDIAAFQKKNWLGNLGTYFFTFLAIWVLMLNVPFSDHAKPTVEKVIVWVGSEGSLKGAELRNVPAEGGFVWVALNKSDDVTKLISKSANSTVNITARVSDNGKLASVKISIGSQSDNPPFMTNEGDSRYGFKITSGELGTTTGLMFYIFADDSVGNSLVFFPDRVMPVAS
jgi:hypothetical protein